MSRAPARSRVSVGSTRSSEAHEAILAAAAEVLRERGYGGFTIEGVAKAAKASKPTIYRWWPSKAALIHELYCRRASDALQVPDLGSLEKELTELTRRTWALWNEGVTSCVVRGLIAEAQAGTGALRQLRDDFLPAQRQLAWQLFERSQRRGEIAADADLEAAFATFKGFGWFHLLTHRIGQADEAAIPGAMRLIVRGLGAVPARPDTAG
jgi:AcrR family transcriptional regulator